MSVQEVLTKKKLLEAVRARKAIQALQQLPPVVPAPLLYNIPPRWREQYPRRPDNIEPLPTGRIALTFGERAESRAGGPMVGDSIAPAGFTVEELAALATKFQRAQLVRLHELLPPDKREGNDAAVLHIKQGVQQLGFDPRALLLEQGRVDYDKMAFSSRYGGRTVNSIARHNIVFGPQRVEHSDDYKQNTVASWAEVPRLAAVRAALSDAFGPKATALNAEGNHYYDVVKCGIGFHGDAERKIVVCCSLGESSTLRYYWRAPANSAESDSASIDLQLEHGDIYIMSEKASGFDFKRRASYRLVHAAGGDDFISRRAAVAPVPQPRLVGIELNPGPFPLEPTIANLALSTTPPPHFIAEAQQALAGMGAAQQQELVIRIAFASNQLYREGSALQQRAQQQQKQLQATTIPDPRHVDPTNAELAVFIEREKNDWSGRSAADFVKHHDAVEQAFARRERDFNLATSALRETAAKLHALDSMKETEQRRFNAKQQSRLMLDESRRLAIQAAQLKQQARAALTAPAVSAPQLLP